MVLGRASVQYNFDTMNGCELQDIYSTTKPVFQIHTDEVADIMQSDFRERRTERPV